MNQGLCVVHRLGAQPLAERPGPYLLWRTCVRQVVIGWTGDELEALAAENDEVYQGEAAYRFLLEVVCGLHSPVVGETEVLGQFKELIKAVDFNTWAGGAALKNLFADLLTDAKVIRDSHLTNLGAQSYGSLVRKYTRGHQRVVLVGSGQLAEEILPWLLKDLREVVVAARSPQKALRLTTLGNIKVVGLTQLTPLNLTPEDVLVVAAPVTAQELSAALQASSPSVLDLRGEGVIDPLEQKQVLDLQKIFAELQAVKTQAHQRAEEARKAARELSRGRFLQVRLRPFGWDDLCA
jgi:glutamyl-tRNA reductase